MSTSSDAQPKKSDAAHTTITTASDCMVLDNNLAASWTFGTYLYLDIHVLTVCNLWLRSMSHTRNMPLVFPLRFGRNPLMACLQSPDIQKQRKPPVTHAASFPCSSPKRSSCSQNTPVCGTSKGSRRLPLIPPSAASSSSSRPSTAPIKPSSSAAKSHSETCQMPCSSAREARASGQTSRIDV